MITKMPNTLCAYIAGLLDGIAGQVGVHFRWDEAYSTVVVRGHQDLLEWFKGATGVPWEPDSAGGVFWSVNGPDLLELLKQIRPYAVRKAQDYDQMIKWLETQSAKAPTAGIMPC